MSPYPTALKKFYVIGNGFDIHHRIKCKYSDFRRWLRQNRPEVLGKLTRLYGRLSGDWWRTFEESLANFKPNAYPKKVEKMKIIQLIHYLSEEYGEEGRDYINDFQISMQEHGGLANPYQRAEAIAKFEMLHLKDDLCEAFGEWVKDIKIPKRVRKTKVSLDTDALFFTFNYTRTLEDTYEIEEDQIVHLHGSVDTNEFIIGHNMTVEQMQERDLVNHAIYRNPDNDRGSDNARMAMFEVLESELKKPVDDVIYFHRNDFNELYGMTEMEVLGLSYSPIDLPYLRHILSITGTDIKVKLGWHRPEDKEAAESFAKEMNLNNYITEYF